MTEDIKRLVEGERKPLFYCADCDELRPGSVCSECGGRTDQYLHGAPFTTKETDHG